MITAFTNPDASKCDCPDDTLLDDLRALIAAGHNQVEVSHLLWGDRSRVSLETQLAYAAHQRCQTRERVRCAFRSAFPWLRIPLPGGAA